MLLAYMDESYDSRVYWMVALLCPDREAIPLTEALDRVVEKASRSYGISNESELHGYDILHGKGDWESLADKTRARIGVYGDALQAIADCDVGLMLRGVDIERLNRRYAYPDHPHSVVLTHLIERVDESAEHRNELVLVIADEVDGEDTYRRNLWHFQRFSTGGWRSRRIERVVDTIHFAPSVSSRLLQAADLVGFLHFRITTQAPGADERAVSANRTLWERIEPNVRHRHCWLP